MCLFLCGSVVLCVYTKLKSKESKIRNTLIVFIDFRAGNGKSGLGTLIFLFFYFLTF